MEFVDLKMDWTNGYITRAPDSKVWDVVQVSGKNVMQTSSVVTTSVVTHRYGGQAGEITQDYLHATVAQTIVQVIVTPEIAEVEDLNANAAVREEGGLGSTGVSTLRLEWLCTQMIELKQLKMETLRGELHVFGEKCGAVLITDKHENTYTFDLETRKMEEVVAWPHGQTIFPWNVMPLEIDWPAIFVSRLTS
ncbi:hypothetical protein VPH35_056750 [Triticum aestivum]|uniref:Senescence domain-containing protein n=1 Tax=Triticum aestivum TaxID=4565 RepID=A0A080YUI0_WHEAT|nr:unnamed protein product [Triticum aestivum]